MSYGKDYLHSHSGLERNLRFPKHVVLVDEKYAYMFSEAKPFSHNNIVYYRVPTMEFVRKGGVFKNLES